MILHQSITSRTSQIYQPKCWAMLSFFFFFFNQDTPSNLWNRLVYTAVLPYVCGSVYFCAWHPRFLFLFSLFYLCWVTVACDRLNWRLWTEHLRCGFTPVKDVTYFRKWTHQNAELCCFPNQNACLNPYNRPVHIFSYTHWFTLTYTPPSTDHDSGGGWTECLRVDFH